MSDAMIYVITLISAYIAYQLMMNSWPRVSGYCFWSTSANPLTKADDDDDDDDNNYDCTMDKADKYQPNLPTYPGSLV